MPYKKVTDKWYYRESEGFFEAEGVLKDKVVIPGFEGFDFARLKIEGEIQITEGRTGQNISTRSGLPLNLGIKEARLLLERRLKSDAEELAAICNIPLAEAYKDAFEEFLDRIVQKYGLSPRYKEVA